jgi:hypothetical protein
MFILLFNCCDNSLLLSISNNLSLPLDITLSNILRYVGRKCDTSPLLFSTYKAYVTKKIYYKYWGVVSPPSPPLPPPQEKSNFIMGPPCINPIPSYVSNSVPSPVIHPIPPPPSYYSDLIPISSSHPSSSVYPSHLQI